MCEVMWSRIGAETPTEIDQCSHGHGPAGRNCISQCVKSNSRFYHKYFCKRKICFMFLSPLCILISFLVFMLLKSRACSHQIYSLIPSILSYMDFYKLVSLTDSKHPGGSAANTPTLSCCMFVPASPRRKACAAALCYSFIYVQEYTNVAMCLP